MPKLLEKKLMTETRHKFHSITSPRAKAYIYGTLRKTGWTPKRHRHMHSKESYTDKMFGNRRRRILGVPQRIIK